MLYGGVASLSRLGSALPHGGTSMLTKLQIVLSFAWKVCAVHTGRAAGRLCKLTPSHSMAAKQAKYQYTSGMCNTAASISSGSEASKSYWHRPRHLDSWPYHSK